jgi:diguanylate cyclase (GGDEF)-like protein
MLFATKVKRIYPYLHAFLLAAGFLWCYAGDLASGPRDLILFALLSYAILILVFNWLHSGRYFSADKLYFVCQFFDAAIIAMLIRHTGGLDSEFYLAFFPVVALASIFCSGWRSLVGALWYGICYFLAVYNAEFWGDDWQTGLFRLVAIWSVGLVTNAVAHFMRSSEKKLLKTLDTLNERTWELESSQLQLSNIYETTTALSGILDMDQLLEEILRVSQNIFRFQQCRIFLSNITGDNLYLYAALDKGNRHMFDDPLPYGRDISGLIDAQDQSSMMSKLNRKNRNNGSNQVDIPLLSRGKVIGIMQIITETGKLPSGRDRRLLMIFSGSAAIAIDNSLLHKKTEELTIIDALTELYNYRYFRTKLTDELRRADRYRQKLSILMLDLDHFKDVNDRYGHQTGNVILPEVSDIIEQCVRDIEVVARYGDEEFVVILPQTHEEDAATIAERIRETVEKNHFPNSDGQREIRITVSLGVATYPEGIHNLDQLLEKVDRALYRAKADGRNRVCRAEKAKRRTAEVNK